MFFRFKPHWNYRSSLIISGRNHFGRTIPARLFLFKIIKYLYIMYCVYNEPVSPMPPSKTFHIIWNLILADKQLELTQETIDTENICHIVAILPHKSDFLELNTKIKEFPYTVLEYGDTHTATINRDEFHVCGTLIDSLAKKEGRRNVLIFCNNGYQRSIPFLVYYLTTFHSDEVPTIERALSIILTQVDKENYMKILADTILAVKKLIEIAD